MSNNRPKRTPGTIALSFYTSDRRACGKGVSIAIEDQISGSRILEVDLSMMEFAQMMSGLMARPCWIEMMGQNFGKISEHKTEVIETPENRGPYKERDKWAAKQLQPYEKDGWRGRADDLLNHHRDLGKGEKEGTRRHTVNFWRYVDPTPEMLEERMRYLREHGFLLEEAGE